jgi:hypothetical protein
LKEPEHVNAWQNLQPEFDVRLESNNLKSLSIQNIILVVAVVSDLLFEEVDYIKP